MSPREQQFARRRTELQLQCAQQRSDFEHSVDEMQASVQGLNRGLAFVRGARIVPMLLAAVGTVGALSRAGGVARLLGKAWLIWQTVQRLRRPAR
jgi:hypothetical protein